MSILRMAFCLPFMAVSVPAMASDRALEISGQIDTGFRYFFEDGTYSGQQDAGAYPFVGFQLGGSIEAGPGDIVFQFTGLNDDRNDRSVFNIQKAYFTTSFDTWDLVLGYNVEDWGVSNGRTIVNVLNSKNRTNQVGNSDLLGTPMANANLFSQWGTFSFYLLGDDIVGNFGGEATRQRGPFPTNDSLVQYEDHNSTDVAFRFTNSFALGNGSLDIGASLYHGTSRQSLRMPGCIQADRPGSQAACDQFNSDVVRLYESGQTTEDAAVNAGGNGFTALTPYYQEMRQFGLTTVYAVQDTQFKFEGFLREASGEEFGAAIVGADHSFFNFMGGQGTLTLALEYHYDGRSERQPVTVYEDDIFIGLNYIANDTSDSRVEFGLFYDLDESSQIYSLSFSRRLGDRFRVSLNANHVHATNPADTLSLVDGDSYFDVTLSTFF